LCSSQNSEEKTKKPAELHWLHLFQYFTMNTYLGKVAHKPRLPTWPELNLVSVT